MTITAIANQNGKKRDTIGDTIGTKIRKKRKRQDEKHRQTELGFGDGLTWMCSAFHHSLTL